MGGTRSETKLNGEINHTMARRFGILSWTLLRSCVIDLDRTIQESTASMSSEADMSCEDMQSKLVQVKLEAARCLVQFELTLEEQSNRVRELGGQNRGTWGQASTMASLEKTAAVERWTEAIGAVHAEKTIQEEVEMLQGGVAGVFDLWEEMVLDLSRGVTINCLGLTGCDLPSGGGTLIRGHRVC